VKTENLTLRDYFAAKAMESMLLVLMQESENSKEVEKGLPGVTSNAYRIADLMLLERAQQ
jgi:hypothetical protein